MTTTMLITMVLCFALTVSVAVSIGLASILGIQVSNANMLISVKEMFASINKFPLAAIPFFILAGNLMETGGISRRLVEFAKSIVGGVQGGLPMTCVLTCMIFAAVSGSSVATTFAIGAILIPALIKHGYPTSYAAALQAHYAKGGDVGPWAERHVSAYASAHPWEDWAETWAHYLHMMDAVDTALGFGMSADAYHMTSPLEDGSGGSKSAQAALANAGINPDQVQYVNAHGTSTPQGDVAEVQGIKRTFGDHAKKLVVNSTKSMTGHLLGAAGAIEAVFSVLAIRDQIAPPTINLDDPEHETVIDLVPHKGKPMKIDVAMSNSFGFGGTNAAVIFKKVD